MWILRLKALAFLAIIVSLGMGVWLHYQQNPDQPPLPETVLGPLYALRDLMDQRGIGLRDEIDRLARDIEQQLYALGGPAPESYRRAFTQSTNDEASNADAAPAVEGETASTRYASPGEGLSALKKELEASMNLLETINAPDLARRANELYERVARQMEENVDTLSGSGEEGE